MSQAHTHAHQHTQAHALPHTQAHTQAQLAEHCMLNMLKKFVKHNHAPLANASERFI